MANSQPRAAKGKPHWEKIMQDAQIICDLVADTHLDYRGTLLRVAGELLCSRCQGYTGGLLQQIGADYGELPQRRKNAKR